MTDERIRELSECAGACNPLLDEAMAALRDLSMQIRGLEQQRENDRALLAQQAKDLVDARYRLMQELTLSRTLTRNLDAMRERAERAETELAIQIKRNYIEV